LLPGDSAKSIHRVTWHAKNAAAAAAFHMAIKHFPEKMVFDPSTES
jgi:hypothetical protein